MMSHDGFLQRAIVEFSLQSQSTYVCFVEDVRVLWSILLLAIREPFLSSGSSKEIQLLHIAVRAFCIQDIFISLWCQFYRRRNYFEAERRKLPGKAVGFGLKLQ
jgi:hypothetical protein